MKKFLNGLTVNHKIALSYLAFFCGIGFGIAGIVIYPAGIIHGSVLILVAQLFVLSGTFVGLDVKFDLNNKYFHARQNEITENRKDIDIIKQALAEDDLKRKKLQNDEAEETTKED